MILYNILYFTNIIYNIEKKLIRNYKLSIKNYWAFILLNLLLLYIIIFFHFPFVFVAHVGFLLPS